MSSSPVRARSSLDEAMLGWGLSDFVCAAAKVCDEREMIGGDKCGAAFVEREAFKRERGIVVDVIEVDERERAGIGARSLEMLAEVCTLEMFGEKVRGQTARPFVEVAEHDARAVQFLVS